MRAVRVCVYLLAKPCESLRDKVAPRASAKAPSVYYLHRRTGQPVSKNRNRIPPAAVQPSPGRSATGISPATWLRGTSVAPQLQVRMLAGRRSASKAGSSAFCEIHLLAELRPPASEVTLSGDFCISGPSIRFFSLPTRRLE